MCTAVVSPKEEKSQHNIVFGRQVYIPNEGQFYDLVNRLIEPKPLLIFRRYKSQTAKPRSTNVFAYHALKSLPIL